MKRTARLSLSLLCAVCLSCSSRIYVHESPSAALPGFDSIVILSNPVSLVIPVGVYPQYKDISYFVQSAIPAVEPIDSLLLVELEARNIPSIRKDTLARYTPGHLYLKYQDYWAWDLKQYMHVMWIGLYDSDEKLQLEVISQGNTAGIHNFPNPGKQVPIMVDQLVEKLDPQPSRF